MFYFCEKLATFVETLYTLNMSDITSEFLIIIIFVIDFTIDILYVVYKLITIMYDIIISGGSFLHCY